MQIEKIGKALFAAREFGIDGIDLMILQTAISKLQSGGEVTIMSFTKSDFASFGTIHVRIKKLIEAGFLTKTIKSSNQRVKTLDVGPKVEEFEQFLNNIK